MSKAGNTGDPTSKRQGRKAQEEENRKKQIDDLTKKVSQLEAAPKKGRFADRNLFTWVLGIALTITLFVLKERSCNSDKEKFDQDKSLQGDLRSAPIDSNFQSKVDTNAFVPYGSKEFKQADTLPPKTKNSKNAPEIKGILIDKYQQPVFTQQGGLYFRVGQIYKGGSAQQLANMEPVNLLPLKGNACRLSKPLLVTVRGNRLYLSVEFNNLSDGTPIGKMEFNHWTLWRGEFLTYDYDEKTQHKFEVIDKDGYIALSVEYADQVNDPSSAAVYISGYLMDDQQVLVMNAGVVTHDSHFGPGFDTCFSQANDPQFKLHARDEIGRINSLFGKPNLKSGKPRF